MKKILLVMSVVSVLFLVGCNKDENIENNNSTNITENSELSDKTDIGEVKTDTYGINGVFTVLNKGVEENLIGTYAFERENDGVYARKTDGTEVKIVDKLYSDRGMCYDDGKLYSATIQYDENNNGTFFYSVVDLTDENHNIVTKQLPEDVDMSFIIGSYNNMIYYNSFKKDTEYIAVYSMKDNTNKILYTTEGIIRLANINKDKGLIYFVEDAKENDEYILYSYNINTEDINEILTFTTVNRNGFEYYYELFKDIFVYQEKTDGLLYEYNLKDNKRSILLEDIPYGNILFKEDKLYYTTLENGKCSIIKYDGNHKEVIYTKDVKEGVYFQLYDYGLGNIFILECNGGVAEGHRIIDVLGNEINEETINWHSVYYLK